MNSSPRTIGIPLPLLALTCSLLLQTGATAEPKPVAKNKVPALKSYTHDLDYKAVMVTVIREVNDASSEPYALMAEAGNTEVDDNWWKRTPPAFLKLTSACSDGIKQLQSLKPSPRVAKPNSAILVFLSASYDYSNAAYRYSKEHDFVSLIQWPNLSTEKVSATGDTMLAELDKVVWPTRKN
jgi:hypothetical protein